jgi:hypothetical protein
MGRHECFAAPSELVHALPVILSRRQYHVALFVIVNVKISLTQIERASRSSGTGCTENIQISNWPGGANQWGQMVPHTTREKLLSNPGGTVKTSNTTFSRFFFLYLHPICGESYFGQLSCVLCGVFGLQGLSCQRTSRGTTCQLRCGCRRPRF